LSIRLANAPVSWGIFEFDGIAPRYPWSQVLEEIAEAGYQGTELGPYGYLPTDPAILRHQLQRRGLRLLSAFVPVELANPEAHSAGVEEALKVGTLLQELHADAVILADANGLRPELVARAGQRQGCWLSDWSAYARGVERIVSAVQDQLGLRVFFHHHCAGLVETEAEVEALLENTRVDLCLDTGHWHYAGGDAVECLRRWGSRVGYLHLKDCHPEIAADCRRNHRDYLAAVQAGVFCSLGEGSVDFQGLLSQLKAHGYEGWAVVEQDLLVEDSVASTPARFARQNREYLQRLGW